MSIFQPSNLVPIMVGDRSLLRLTPLSNAINGVSNITCIAVTPIIQPLTTTPLTVNIRIPDILNRGTTSAGGYNFYFQAPASASCTANYPSGLGAGGSVALQNVVPPTTVVVPCNGTYNPVPVKPGGIISFILNETTGTGTQACTFAMSASSLNLSDYLQSAPTCPLPLGSGESFTINDGVSAVLVLNRVLTAGTVLGVINLLAKANVTTTYTITSSNTAIIATSTGSLSPSASFIANVTILSSVAVATPIILTFTLPGVGAEGFVNLMGV
jgi:hypothetical protein